MMRLHAIKESHSIKGSKPYLSTHDNDIGGSSVAEDIFLHVGPVFDLLRLEVEASSMFFKL